MYEVIFTKQALKDRDNVIKNGLSKQAKALIEILKENPYKTPPYYEKLLGNLKGAYSRRLNRQHRLVYMVYEDEKKVKILRMWMHYQ